MSTVYKFKPFRFNLSDLNFMRDQINFRPLFDAAGNAIVAWDGTGAIYDSNNLSTRTQLWDGILVAGTGGTGIHTATQAIAAYGTSYDTVTASQGLRDVTGLNNNLLFVNHTWGAADQPFLQRVQANFNNYVQAHRAGDAGAFYANHFSTANTALINGANTDYTKTGDNLSTTAVEGHAGSNVVDYTPRMISQLTTTAGATPLLDAQGHPVHWYASQYVVGSAYWNLFNAKTAADAAVVTDLELWNAAIDAVPTAQSHADAALAAYNSAYATDVENLVRDEAIQLDLLNQIDQVADPAAWDAQNENYQIAGQATSSALSAIAPLQDALDDANSALDFAKANVIDTHAAYDAAVRLAAHAVNIPATGHIEGAFVITHYGLLETLGQHDPQNPDNHEAFVGAVNPGVAPGNGWLAMFGQFFDHGLDFIGKGGDGTKITIPLALDDPMYGVIGPDGRPATSITISRANVSGFDAAGNAQWINHTSPYIDQSQTYGSSGQMTQLLREWVANPVGEGFHAGAHLLDGATSVAWKNAWGETIHATLPTLNELRAHLLATGRDDLSWNDVLELRNRDAHGDVIAEGQIGAGGSGQALLLDMNPHFDTAHLSTATQDALHTQGINPDATGSYALGGPGSLGAIINFATFAPKPGFEALAAEVLLESVGDHYIAGDGRVNENVALTTIHHVFHEEHNYQVRNIEASILAQDARAVVLGDSSHSIAHEWQTSVAAVPGATLGSGVTLVAGHYEKDGNYTDAAGHISWDDARMFDAAKLTVEMEYQHTAVDQYARTITPDLPEFVGYNSGENASVSLDYAQVAFRFGHSTIRESIDLIDPAGGITGKVMSIALEQGFLNPQLFANKGAASIALGMTHQQMNEIDEFITPALNQGLLGQPLDLAAINIARGRDVGIPTLNEFRVAVGLSAYTGWSDFGANMIHPDNLVNFIAAYSFDGDLAKAQAIIGLENGSIADTDSAAMGYTFDTAIAFLSGGDNGVNKIDTWLGGLAEAHVAGGLLGETFNLVFVEQINRLMDGDRFYYLYRLNGLNMGDEIGNAQFKDIIERNTGLEHLNGSAFAYADQYFDLSQHVDANNTTGNFRTDHKYGVQLAANPTLGVFSDGGNSTNANGSIVTIGGVQYVRDVRQVITPNTTNNLAGLNLDGTPDSGANSNEVLVGTDKNDLIYMRAGDDTAYGEGGDDIIYGGAGIDRLYGGDGNDIIHGEDGGDLIDGGDGDDILYGESSQSSAAGVDQLIGGAGNDILFGGVGIDKLSGGSGDDVIFGGNDTDAFTHGGDGNDYIDGQADGDLLWGDGGDDLIVGGNNQDILGGGDGDDILRPGNPSSAAGGGPDEVVGGAGGSDLGNDGKGIGFDMIDFSDFVAAPLGVTADFSTQAPPIGAINLTTAFPAWADVEGFIGSRNNDTALGDANANWLIGGSGNDSLTGGAGNDVIIGDGIRLDSLIGTYSGGYTNTFDEATHRALGSLGTAGGGHNGLLDVVGTGFDKHFTEMLRSEMFSNLELGGSTIRTLIGGGTTGDGGSAGSDTAVFSGNRLDYSVVKIVYATANQGDITAYRITDNVAGRDGSDVVVGVENFKFADGTVSEAQLPNLLPVITSNGGGATATILTPENTTALTTVTAIDPNNTSGDQLNPQVLTYSISGGADASKFAIDAGTGVLSFINAPNFEAPTDAGANNVYDVVVQVSDGLAVDSQALAITVQNVNEVAVGEMRIASYTGAANTASLFATGTLLDPDGMSNLIQYQWQRLANGVWVDIAGATGATSPTNLSNANFRVVSTYTDAFGTEIVVSSDTAVIGTSGNNTLAATAGNDILLGLDGNDNLTGNAGNDKVDGGAGTDTFNATINDGNDIYIGGAGTDTYNLSATSVAATVNLTTGTAASAQIGTDTLTTIENVVGGSGDDTITDGAGANQLDGGAGNDTFILTADNTRDTLIGGANSDTVDYSAHTANLTVTLNGNTAAIVTGSGSTNANSDQITAIENFVGGSGADTITGDAGVNQINGGAGADLIRGGQGADVLTGGLGLDRFIYGNTNESGIAAASRDIITDFASGIDKLDFSGIDANTATAGTNDAFSAMLSGTTFSAAGQLRFHYEFVGVQEYTVVEANVNTNLAADFQVALLGHHTFVASDIIL
jgi:Ca2+-binding RTX toxin-like protein